MKVITQKIWNNKKKYGYTSIVGDKPYIVDWTSEGTNLIPVKIISNPKRITLATIKKFIKDNKGSLYIKVETSFDGMQDCIESVHNSVFRKAEMNTEFSDKCIDNTLGIQGLWLVKGSRDYFNPYEDDIYKGIEYSNCCGSGCLVIKKGY